MLEYLPIGSVVAINNKKIMITGYFVKKYTDKLEEFDYEGVPYPAGSNSKEIYCFNNKDITKLLYKGYEEKEYEKINQFFNANKSKAVHPVISNNLAFDEYGKITKKDNNKPSADFKMPTYKFEQNGITITN